MSDLASFDAALQLLLAFGTLLQVVAGFLIFISAFLALLLFAAVCVAVGDRIDKGARWMAAHVTPALAKSAAARWELKSKVTHA